MASFSYKTAILFSYKTFFRLLVRTYCHAGGTQAQLTPRRFIIMSLLFPVLFLLNSLHWLGLLLDEILFPGYREVEVAAPLFIVGIPRSGTSYLHRLIARDSARFTTLTLWELLLAPSITERKLLGFMGRWVKTLAGPLSGAIGKLGQRAVCTLDAIHEIRITEPEEDYFLLIPLFACFLMILPFPFPDVLEHLSRFDDCARETDKQLIMGYYKSCLKRHLYIQGPGKRFLSKNVAFAPMVAALNDTFPDCKIVCNIRNPLKSVPSHISSMMAGVEIFGNDPREHEFRDQLINVQHYAFSHVSDFLPKLPLNRHAFVRMEDLKQDVSHEIACLYDRFGYEMTASFKSYLAQERESARQFKSGHAYTLSSFDLSAETISRKFAFVFERFGYPKDAR